MKIPLKLLINERFARKDGTCFIYVQYSFNRNRRPLLNTGIEIPPAFWDEKSKTIHQNLPGIFGSAEDLNLQLLCDFRVAEDLVILALKRKVSDPSTFVKDNFKPNFDIFSLKQIEEKYQKENVSQNLDLYFQIDDYIQSKTKKVCKDMPRIYRNMKDHLLEFEVFRKEPITFECLNLTFYEEFVDFLMYEYVQRRRKEKIVGLKVNTVGKTIKQFRTFLRNRIRKGIIPVIDMDGWKILEEEVDAVYLNWAEIKKVFEVDLTKKSTHDF